MTTYAVIGSGYGDEGKGLITDYLAIPDSIVIRYNGGAQAGHTVTTENFRHVFHHFGSGTLRGAKTYLSRYFILNPYIFNTELDTLVKADISPVVYCDEWAMITTPYDMMINQMAEEHRGNERHGSCGVGINETIVRCDSSHRTNMRDACLWNFGSRLKNIRDDYLPWRLKDMGIPFNETWKRRVRNDKIFDEYVASMERMKKHIILLEETDIVAKIKTSQVIFEGAQGLMLDRGHRFYPHVTPSKTGLPNISAIMGRQTNEKPELNLIYVTRAYATRHGAGPFPNEIEGMQFEDKTNVPNMWQSNLRFGHLNLDLMREAILNDQQYEQYFTLSSMMAITCMDQVGDEVFYILEGETFKTNCEGLIAAVEKAIGIRVKYISTGPTRNDVKELF